jgi:peroxiredoxin
MKRKVLPLVLLVLCLSVVQAVSQQNLRVGSMVPQFTGTSSDGVEYSLAGLRGKVVVLTFWSTRCEICRVELPRLDEVVRQNQARPVEFLALSPESDDMVAAYMRNHPFRFKAIPNSFGPLLQYADRDRSGNVMMQYPAFFVIGQDGRLVYRASGYGRTDELNSAIRQAASLVR